ALRSLRVNLQRFDHTRIEAGDGLGNHLYGLVRVAGLLGDGELLELARRVAGWFVPQRIAACEFPEALGGLAGGSFGLLAVSAVEGTGAALSRAVHCGDHLLKHFTDTDTGHRAWRSPSDPRCLTGFAHGAAGIACALVRLSQATGEGRFREAAEEGIAYETAV